MENKFVDLFAFINVIEEEQAKQKKRGLNNYNMVNVVRNATHEVGMHSNVIYSLINPDGEHFQDDLFLKLFIKYIIEPHLINDNSNYNSFGEILDVQAEELTEKNRRVDFTIKSDKYLIGIEMKVNAHDLVNQVSDYYDYLKGESDNQKVYIFYLTKFGKNVSKKSMGKLDSQFIKKISFQKDILQWIEVSQNEVKNIPNLNMALENYKNIVEKITKKYKGNVVTIEKELLKPENKTHLKTALELDNKMGRIKTQLLDTFFEDKLLKYLTKAGLLDDTANDILEEHPEREASKKKCGDFIKKSKNRPKFFGKSFKLKNGKYLYIYIAVQSLCYGFIDETKLDESFNKKKISNEEFRKYIISVEVLFNARNNFNELLDIEEQIKKISKKIS